MQLSSFGRGFKSSGLARAKRKEHCPSPSAMQKLAVYARGLAVVLFALMVPFPSNAAQAGLPVALSAAPGQMAEPAVGWGWWLVWLIAPVCAVLGLVFALKFYREMMKNSEGEPRMKEIAGYVREGAYAYLKRQNWLVAVVLVLLTGILAVLAFVAKVQSGFVPFAFLIGGALSALCGYLGMKTATNASARTTNSAKQSLNAALQVAFRSGAVMGLMVVGFGLLYVCMWFFVLLVIVPLLGSAFQQDWNMSLPNVVLTMLCFGMGASTQALFARVGGGIFTKAADVGADLVGKIEAGIPEDDPRNPATIADNVGDNVGDVAGMGADLFESYINSILAAVALGVTAGYFFKGAIAPMVVAGLGVALSILGIYLVRTREEASQKALLSALRRGVWSTAGLFALLSLFAIWLIFGLGVGLGIWLAMLAGLLAGVGVGYWTERYTSARYRPTQQLSQQALTGPATVIIEGISVGMHSTALTVIMVVAAFIVAYGTAGGFTDASHGLYGIGMAAVGMLSTLGITLATDAYGPIADNAGGNAEMSGQPEYVRERTDALDALGNTTAATGKGFAIGSAVLTALTLLAAYIEQVRVSLIKLGTTVLEGVTNEGSAVLTKDATISQLLSYYDVTPMNPKVLGGIFIGGMLAFVFCGLTMRAVGRAAGKIVEEVRRQFREIAGIMEGKAKPDYASCVDICTRAAQREMIVPSLLAFIAPVAMGLVLGPAGLIGLLVGVISTGFVLAVMLNNAGGAWDNAKKYIEKGAHGGKGSDAHKAAVVGDTVGDPFKDTSGPSLNILIKLMSIVAVVFAGFVVKYSALVSQYLFSGTR